MPALVAMDAADAKMKAVLKEKLDPNELHYFYIIAEQIGGVSWRIVD